MWSNYHSDILCLCPFLVLNRIELNLTKHATKNRERAEHLFGVSGKFMEVSHCFWWFEMYFSSNWSTWLCKIWYKLMVKNVALSPWNEHQWTSTSINSCDDLKRSSDSSGPNCLTGLNTHALQVALVQKHIGTSCRAFDEPPALPAIHHSKNRNKKTWFRNSPGPTSAEKPWATYGNHLKRAERKQQDMNWTWLNHDERDSDRIQTFCWKRTGKRNLKNHNQCLVGIEKLHSPGPDTDTNNTTIDNDW